MKNKAKMIGDGNPNCPVCVGRGVVDVEDGASEVDDDSDFVTYFQGPVVRICDCVMIRDIVKNANRGWKGLIKAPKVPSSPLIDKTDTSLWVTADRSLFKAHVRHVAVRKGPRWGFIVKSDMDLMTAWLGNIALKRKDIFDADVARESATESLKYHALVDLVAPPELLILQLGVKAARNEAMPEVFEEALLTRESEGKPTWVWDQPDQTFSPGHFCYSDRSHEVLDGYERLHLTGAVSQSRENRSSRRQTPQPQRSSGGYSLSGAMGSEIGGVQSVTFAKPKLPRRKK